ncbi:MAG: DUF2220 domain-containing protein, partial [Lachnospiraceae bacterium]|nr:DUF2220 domain-containing protein [Lachnospiraceae bacterium]
MKFNADKVQQEELSLLLDKYENSRTYKGENQVHQSFGIAPESVLREYHSDFADVEKIRRFEEELTGLEEAGLIRLERKGMIIRKILLNEEALPACYEILGRKDRNAIIRGQISFYEAYLDRHPVLDGFCEEQIARLQAGRRTEYPQEEAERLLSLCLAILENRQELLERELSIVQFGDSKLFEKKYRTRVCRILQKYGDYAELLDGVDDQREKEQILLGEHGVHSNPSYVYIKGAAVLTFRDLPPMELSKEMPLALSSESLERLEKIEIHTPRVMTIENLTSFNRMKEEGWFYLFLSGYHNTVRQRLLRRIAEQNEGLQWFHFGDFDPDGFLIIEHLRKKTGIDFAPIHMGVDELRQYREYGRPREENDQRKAKTLIEKGKHVEEMQFMLEQD